MSTINPQIGGQGGYRPQQQRYSAPNPYQTKMEFNGWIFVVRQQTVAIIERLGRFQKIEEPGIHVRIPFVDRVATRVKLQVMQADFVIESKSKDNVFVQAAVSVQYRVDKTRIKEAYYELSNPVAQLKAYVEDAIRASIPKLTVDEVFERKDDVANEVNRLISEEMSTYGWSIVRTLITTIEPDQKVKDSMNEINAAQRQRAAAQELAEADRIRIVTKAKAEAEQAELQGVGLANQRKAIVNGLSESFDELRNSGLDEQSILSVLLANQYMDTLNKFADGGNGTVFLPSSPSGIEDIRTEIMSSIVGSHKAAGACAPKE
ncbi:MAG: SPFH domain-containing protein [Lactobacillales bacterium]|jgi:regulator of protease activity HflC (stomatin/prohibitin superfamily)|nr:SPFH domain-containing protein [Lactobacillales bacterium]